jgi:hypothetical protein
MRSWQMAMCLHLRTGRKIPNAAFIEAFVWALKLCFDWRGVSRLPKSREADHEKAWICSSPTTKFAKVGAAPAQIVCEK